MRTLAKFVVFVFSLLHWFVSQIVAAHLTVLRNFQPRSRLEARERQVRRG